MKKEYEEVLKQVLSLDKNERLNLMKELKMSLSEPLEDGLLSFKLNCRKIPDWLRTDK